MCESDLSTETFFNDKNINDEDYCSKCGSPKLNPKDKCKTCEPESTSIYELEKKSASNGKFLTLVYKLVGVYIAVLIIMDIAKGVFGFEKCCEILGGGIALIIIAGIFNLIFDLFKFIKTLIEDICNFIKNCSIKKKSNLAHVQNDKVDFQFNKIFPRAKDLLKYILPLTSLVHISTCKLLNKIRQEKIILLKVYLVLLSVTCLYVPWYTYSVQDYAKIPTTLGYNFIFTPPYVTPVQYGIIDVNRIILEVVALSAIFGCLYIFFSKK